MDYVQAAQKDVDLALELGGEVFSRNCDDVPPTGRALLAGIVKLVTEKHQLMISHDNKSTLLLSEVPFTRKELRESLGWSETQVRRNADHLVELGYLGCINGRQGATCRYLLLDDGSADPVFSFTEGEEPFTKNQ
jgi:hypothetical protein